MLPIEKYREIMETSPICTVDVLFFNSDKTKTLLFKRTNEPLKGVYFSVGGRLLKNESIEECAIRQAKREVGVSIPDDRLVYGGWQEEIHSNSIFEGVSYHAIDFFYGYILESEDIRLDNQHDEYLWFSVNDKTLHPFIQTKLEDLVKAYGKKL